jgi:uncharacterized protein YlbG (UPF0298 family)
MVNLISCSSNQISNSIQDQREAIEENVREDKIVGKDLPDWVHKSGIENGKVFTVGVAEMRSNKSPVHITKAAVMDGETKLLSDAPADFRIVTQNAMNGAGIDSNEFYQIQTKIQEVVGLVGLKTNSEKITCRKIIRYGAISTDVNRICYVQVYIPVRELMKAYKRTLALKFGQGVSERFQDKMEEELKKTDSMAEIKAGSNKKQKVTLIGSSTKKGKQVKR